MGDLLIFCQTILNNSSKDTNAISMRGPLLAHLEIYNRLIKHNYFPNNELQIAIKLGNFYNIVNTILFFFSDSPLTYIKKIVEFSHSKPFCFTDIKLYLKLLDDNLIQKLIDYIEVLSKSDIVTIFKKNNNN